MKLVVVLLGVLVVLEAAVYDPEETLDLFEGDIELPPSDGFRSTINEQNKLWPNARVPYRIEDPKGLITDAQRENLTLAMEYFHKKTCVRFYEDNSETIREYLRIQKSKGGCSSNVGMMSNIHGRFTGQTVRLSDECFEIGKISHELMHSLGFFHEQSRHDRDKYVKIVPQNVEQGKLRQFRMYDVTKQNVDLGAPYDYGSLMHYPKWAFSRGYEMDTIIPLYDAEIGQRRAMSEIDVWKINKLYNCPNVGPVPKAARVTKTDMDEKLPFSVERSFKCNFEFFYTCDLRDEMKSDFDWRLGNGQASKHFKTGPKAGSDGEECCYIHTDALLQKPGAKGTVVTPVMQPTLIEGSCFSFAYHMYGSTVGSLEVFWRTLGTKEENMLFKQTGNQGEKWFRQHFVLHIDRNFEIVFRATVGGNEISSYEGMIALDDLRIVPMLRLRIKGKKCE